MWDVENVGKQKSVMIAKSSQPGQRMTVNSAAFSPDGKLIVAGIQNGSIKVWPYNGPHHRPSQVRGGQWRNHHNHGGRRLTGEGGWPAWGASTGVQETNAHENGRPITSVTVAHDNQTILSRSGDHTMKRTRPARAFDDGVGARPD